MKKIVVFTVCALMWASIAAALEQPVLPDDSLFEFKASKQFECGSISFRDYSEESTGTLWLKYYLDQNKQPFLIQKAVRADMAVLWNSWIDKDGDGKFDEHYQPTDSIREKYPTLCDFFKK